MSYEFSKPSDGITEAEAKGKACCANTSLGCYASSCMAWRWAGNNGEWTRRKLTSDLLTPLPVGFCGLAELRAYIIKGE